jgi:hypothetical protein
LSQQTAAGPDGSCGSRKPRHFPQGGGELTKGCKSPIFKIAGDTFNMGQNKFAAQFTQSRKNVANYLQLTTLAEGYLVAKMVRTRKKQIIELLPPINKSGADTEDQKIIRAKEVKMIAKR